MALNIELIHRLANHIACIKWVKFFVDFVPCQLLEQIAYKIYSIRYNKMLVNKQRSIDYIDLQLIFQLHLIVLLQGRGYLQCRSKNHLMLDYFEMIIKSI